MEPETLNPTVLAKDCGVRYIRAGEGDGKLLNWETFWDLVEKTYWRNRALAPTPQKRNLQYENR